MLGWLVWIGVVQAQTPPEGWVDLQKRVPNARLDIRYHTADNFTGAPLPGYGQPGAWLAAGPAASLAQVQTSLEEQGLGLIIYDAYRPLRGTRAMVAWATRTNQVHLLDGGYIARRSNHNRGNTVDVSLVRLVGGVELDMGTAWDTLSPASHTKNATGQASANREILVRAMAAHGWKNYHREWWHFTHTSSPPGTHRDVPYGCFEPKEGSFVPPPGWDAPGYEPSMDWPDAPCVP